MPLKGTYTWQDKNDSIKVSIPLKGVSPSQVDIFVTESTFKVNFSPYLIDVVLQHKINPAKHKATVKAGTLIITLIKQDNSKKWINFEIQDQNREILSTLKSEALEQQQKFESEMKTKRKDRKVEDERVSIRKSMSLTTEERERLEALKEEEKVSAEKEVYETFAKLKKDEEERDAQKQLKTKPPSTTSESSVALKNSSPPISPLSPPSVKYQILEEEEGEGGGEGELVRLPQKKEINWDDIDEFIEEENADADNGKEKEKTQMNPTEIEEQEKEAEVRYILPPRSAGISKESDMKVNILYTPRVFPTPMRESKVAEEEDWVAKNRRHLKSHGILGKNLTRGNGVNLSEEDPAWMKGKGDDFFRNGDYRSAINIYTSALEIDDSLLSSLSNRSLCYLKLNLFAQCQQDCDALIHKICQEIEHLHLRHSANDLLSSSPSLSPSPSPSLSPSPSPLSSIQKIYTNPHIFLSFPVQTRELLKKTLLRRGAVLCQTGHFRPSLSDMQQVEKILEKEIEEEKKMLKMVQDMSGDKSKRLLVVAPEGTVSDQHTPSPASASASSSPASALTSGEKELHGKYLKLTQFLSSIQRDLQNIQLLVNVDELKISADLKFGSQQLSEAESLYSQALDLFPAHVGCLSNRSACYLALGQHEKCILDCSQALELLKLPTQCFGIGSGTQSNSVGDMLIAILPPPGTEKRKNWTLRTLLRKGVALSQQGKIAEAIKEYEIASIVDPDNIEIQKDLEKFRSLSLNN